jgi:hypothetical protein
VDHFVPWSRYPDDTLDNVVVADNRCNGFKSSSLAIIYAAFRLLNELEIRYVHAPPCGRTSWH